MIKLDRETIRALAETHMREMQDIAKAGGNHYQVSLEQQDKVEELASSLSEADSAKFLKIYYEEIEACSNSLLDNAKKIELENEKNQQQGEIIGRLIAWAIGVLVLFFSFKSIFENLK